MTISRFTLALMVCWLVMVTPASAVPVLYGPGKITYIENGHAGEGFAIRVSGAQLAGCMASPNANEFGVAKTHPAYKELLAMAMTAYAKQSDVELYVEPNVCPLGRTSVTSIRLK